MKIRLSQPIFAAAIFVSLLTVVPGQSLAAQPKTAAPATPSKQTAPATLARLKTYTNGWKIVEDAQVKRLMKSVMGTSVNEFFNQTQSLSEPEIEGDQLVLRGGVTGLYTQTEAVLDLNLATGAVSVGLLDGDTLTIFSKVRDQKKLPQGMTDYIKDLEGRAAGKKVVFSGPTTKAIALDDGVMKVSPRLNITKLTGTFQRKGTERWDNAVLAVQALPGNKIKFSLGSAHGANTGSAAAVVPIVKGFARYKMDDGALLTIQFKGAHATVKYNSKADSTFGGMGVTADGEYIKKADAVPEFDSADF